MNLRNAYVKTVSLGVAAVLAATAGRLARREVVSPATPPRRASRVVAALVLGAACSARSPGVAAPSEPPAPVVEAPCATAEACMTAATRALQAGDSVRAAEYLGVACDRGDATGCNEAGTLLESDPTQRLARFRRACELDEPFGCANLGRVAADTHEALDAAEKGCNLDAKVCDSGARVAIDAQEWVRARAMAERGCIDTVDVACGTLGSLLAKGLGGPQDTTRAVPLLERGCRAGDENACKNVQFVQPVATSESSANTAPPTGDLEVPHASLTIGSVSADGFTIRDLACNLEGGGLNAFLAGPMLASMVGARKAALRKCAPKGGEARVLFTMRGGKTDARAKAATPAIEACVVKVMKTVAPVSEGTCAATIDLRQ